MKFKSTIFSLALFLMYSSSFAQKYRTVQNANDALENAITAMGGKEFLKSVNTLYSEISTEMDGMPVQWITREMLPNKGSFQIVYQGRVVFQNWFNGTTGYETVKGEKVKADPEEFKNKQYRKNIFNELDFIDSSLWTLEMLEEEKVEGKDCYKIKATLVDGSIKHLYFDKKVHFMVKSVQISNGEKDSFNSVYYSDFKKYGKLSFYSVLRFGEGKDAQIGKVISLLVNEKISESDFN